MDDKEKKKLLEKFQDEHEAYLRRVSQFNVKRFKVSHVIFEIVRRVVIVTVIISCIYMYFRYR